MEIDTKKAIADYLKAVGEWAKTSELATPDAELDLDGPGDEDDLSDEDE
jgi:hypothetical protein